jgi:hypothetical protein
MFSQLGVAHFLHELPDLPALVNDVLGLFRNLLPPNSLPPILKTQVLPLAKSLQAITYHAVKQFA